MQNAKFMKGFAGRQIPFCFPLKGFPLRGGSAKGGGEVSNADFLSNLSLIVGEGLAPPILAALLTEGLFPKKI